MSRKRPNDTPADAGVHALNLDSLSSPPAEVDASVTPPEPEAVPESTVMDPVVSVSEPEVTLPDPQSVRVGVVLRREWNGLPKGTSLGTVEFAPGIEGMSVNRLVDLVRGGLATDAPL